MLPIVGLFVLLKSIGITKQLLGARVRGLETVVDIAFKTVRRDQ